jgi:hypothetical protein
MSAQKWNWAPRKRTARRRAKITTLLRWRSMQVLRPSLGEKGYRVKKYGVVEARELRLTVRHGPTVLTVEVTTAGLNTEYTEFGHRGRRGVLGLTNKIDRQHSLLC